jgi:hypothetical protein
MSDNTQTTETVAPAVNPELTIVDLQNVRSIIDVAARRGAFGAAEMAAVGGVFSKLDTFLTAVTPPAAPAEAPAADTTAAK